MNSAVEAAARKAAVQYNVPLANLLAVIQVESDGKISARIEQRDGSLRDEPLIRWEAHYFDKRLGSNTRAIAREEGLASPTPGKVRNPSSQQQRWDQLLWPAMALNEEAAIESASFGCGQVMGAHWQRLGFSTPQQFLEHVRTDVFGQIDVMMRYCKAFGLIDELQRGDFTGFARGYNGPAFRKYSYDSKMRIYAQRFAKTVSTDPDVPVPTVVNGVPTVNATRTERAGGMVRMGTEGAKVREVQSLLRRAGYAVEIDGDFGPATKEAVRRFQKAHGLEVDGIVGPKTWQALDAERIDPAEKPGVPNAAEAVVQTPQGRKGAVAVGGAVAVETIKGTLDAALAQLGVVKGSMGAVDHLYTVLTLGSVTLALGGAGWVLWGWYRANTTRGVATGPAAA